MKRVSLLMAASLVLLLMAVVLLILQTYVWDAALFAALAIVLVLHQLFRRNRRFSLGFLDPLAWVPKTFAAWLRLGALIGSLAAAIWALLLPIDLDHTLPFLLWLVAVASFAIPMLCSLWCDDAIQISLSLHERWALLGLILTAFLLRAVALDHIPFSLGGDEGTQLLEGLVRTKRPVSNPFATGWYSVPSMSFFAYGLTMRVLGATVAGGRALSALAGTLAVVTTFFLGRTMGGRRVGWWSAAIMATSAYHIHFSRLASNQIADSLFGSLAMGLLWLGFVQRQRPVVVGSAWGLAGIVVGLGWYGYFGARWVTVLMALFLVWRVWVDRALLPCCWRALALMCIGWLIAVLPLVGWYAAHPSPLTERYKAVSVFASGWLVREQALTGQGAVRLMGRQLWKAFTAFHFAPDPTFWYYPQKPLLDIVSGALLLVGLVSSVLRIRQTNRVTILLWFSTTVLMAWGITENPPSSQRGLLLMPAVAIMIAWGLDEVTCWLRVKWLRSRLAYGFLSVIMILNGVFYFAIYTPRHSYGNPTAEVATEVGRYLRAHPQPICATDEFAECKGRLYFLGAPVLRWDFGGLAFLARGMPGEDVPPDSLPVSVSGPARFIVTRYRMEDLARVQSAYPNGVSIRLESPDGRFLAVVYDWAGESSPEESLLP